MNEPIQRKTCPDCEAALQPIKLIDHTRSVIDAELSYTAGDARQGWFGGFPVAGTIRAMMCSQCGRILLYGEASPES